MSVSVSLQMWSVNNKQLADTALTVSSEVWKRATFPNRIFIFTKLEHVPLYSLKGEWEFPLKLFSELRRFRHISGCLQNETTGFASDVSDGALCQSSRPHKNTETAQRHQTVTKPRLYILRCHVGTGKVVFKGERVQENT